MANLNDTSSAKDAATLAVSSNAFQTTRAIYVDVTGSGTFEFADGRSQAFSALPVGLLPFSVRKFTAGTATVIGLW